MIRAILFADTHLGFDYPIRPRVERPRRGGDFFENFERVLDRARETRPDFVVHGGDLFFRSKIPQKIVDMAYGSLFRFADEDIPLFIVPGNHERSRLPQSLLFNHPSIFIFDRPRTFTVEAGGATVALAGFPCERNDIRPRFGELLEQTEWRSVTTDVRLLCLHQAVEGAVVGPADFTFRGGGDVIRRRDLPPELDAVLCGHIHRQQILADEVGRSPGGLCRSPNGSGRTPPVIYPGSIERTSLAEKDEEKGYYELTWRRGAGGAWWMETSFVRLPARPMVDVTIDSGVRRETLAAALGASISKLDPDSVVRLKPAGKVDPAVATMLTVRFLREVFPSTMNVQLGGGFFDRRPNRRSGKG